ncbi:unnamed protein product [Peronospora belbahrii]|uniref:Uncharacterized protein n=1 Tax=Peronospora belbahrii TaxID=622444 RepID=A0AAU9LA15_9STRA|nr:unnamed protein product [Peronospora belbahrii]
MLDADESFGCRETFILPRAIDTEEMHVSSSDSSQAGEIDPQVTVSIEEPALSQSPIVADVGTVQQAMAELLRMQHAIATRPDNSSIKELEKIYEMRLREKEEKTKQRGLELQIEMQRTRWRQLNLEFEKEECKKDREKQAKLITSLLERLEPKRS